MVIFVLDFIIKFMVCFNISYTLVSFFNLYIIGTKNKKLGLEISKKIREKGYREVDDNVNLSLLIYCEILGRTKYARREVTQIVPIFNLYPFFKIISKKIDKEYNTVLDSLDNEEVLNILEENNHIYRKDTISEKINHIENNILFDKNDSLETLTEKRKLLNEMIYLRNLQELEQNNASQESEEEQETVESAKPLKLVKKLFKVDKNKKTE